MERKNGMQSIQSMTIAALLCAVGIVIPMTFPKIWVGPASFTLASHVPIFLAMFISPAVAITVALGTTLGFFLSGLPLVITLRALSHVVFVTIGAIFLKKRSMAMKFSMSSLLFGLILGVIHAASEVIVVTYFFFGGQLSQCDLFQRICGFRAAPSRGREDSYTAWSISDFPSPRGSQSVG
jgi:niacin transporter